MLKGLDDVKKMIAKNKKEMNMAARAVFMDGLGEIIGETPADEGRARNSWFLTVNAPFSLSGGRDPDDGGGGSHASLETMPANVFNKKIFLTNNLPYINLLEYGGYSKTSTTGKTINGFSMQAPEGMARRNLKRMEKKIRSF